MGCVVDSKELVEKVLPLYFKETKFASFTRKLNRWGFRHFTLRASESEFNRDLPIYAHINFQRDNYSAVCEMGGGHHRLHNSNNQSSRSAGVNSSLTSSMSSSSGGKPILNNAFASQYQNLEVQLQNTNLLLSRLIRLQQQCLYQQQSAAVAPQEPSNPFAWM